MNTAFLFLPWPDRRLSPNARVHHMELYRVKREAKQLAYYCALAEDLDEIEADTISVKYTFHPPSRRRYDVDNLLSSMKAASDGIACAIGVDDSNWTIAISKAEPIKGGLVKIELEWPCAEVSA